VRKIESLLAVVLRRTGSTPAGARAAGQIPANLVGLIVFDGAGMRLFLGDAHRGQSIEYFFALYL
jgi:hypothetical protein